MVVCSCNLHRSLDRRGGGGSKRKAAVSPGCAQAAGCLMEAFNSAGDSHVQSVGPEHVANVSSTRRSSRGESSGVAPAARPDFFEPQHYEVGKHCEHFVTTRRKRQKQGAGKAVTVAAGSWWAAQVTQRRQTKEGHEEAKLWYFNTEGKTQEHDCTGWLRIDGPEAKRTVRRPLKEVEAERKQRKENTKAANKAAALATKSLSKPRQSQPEKTAMGAQVVAERYASREEECAAQQSRSTKRRGKGLAYDPPPDDITAASASHRLIPQLLKQISLVDASSNVPGPRSGSSVTYSLLVVEHNPIARVGIGGRPTNKDRAHPATTQGARVTAFHSHDSEMSTADVSAAWTQVSGGCASSTFKAAGVPTLLTSVTSVNTHLSLKKLQKGHESAADLTTRVQAMQNAEPSQYAPVDSSMLSP